MRHFLSTTAVLVLLLTACGPRWQETEADGFKLVTQKGGPTLGYTSATLLTVDGYAFKDLNRNGALDPYEDWRLPAETRAKDLAAQLSVEEIAGLMLYSGHQAVPGSAYGFGGATYGGKKYDESEAQPYDLTDQQRKFLEEDNLRAVLVTTVESPEVAARWNNNVQAFVEALGHGIPANNSSDPRNETAATAEFNMGAGGKISLWPTPLGLAATFDPDLVKRFGEIASEEYRALGIATALSPQIDLATEPRWSRFNGTFGVQNQAVMDIIAGAAEPSGLLPMQFPADMRTVEEQQEDVPHDMRPLVDADGHAWDFAYGLNWSGVIDDARTAKYRK